jgi:hypothetical protein
MTHGSIAPAGNKKAGLIYSRPVDGISINGMGFQSTWGWRKTLSQKIVLALCPLPNSPEEIVAHATDMGVNKNFAYRFMPMLAVCSLVSSVPTSLYHYRATYYASPTDQIVNQTLITFATFSIWAAGLLIPAYRAFVQKDRIGHVIARGRIAIHSLLSLDIKNEDFLSRAIKGEINENLLEQAIADGIDMNLLRQAFGGIVAAKIAPWNHKTR